MHRTLFLLLPAAWLLACDLDKIEHDDDGGGPEAEAEAEQTFPTRVAEAYCAALFACDPVSTCTETEIPYASEAECVQGERTALEQVSATAKDAGMTFDAECVERWLEDYAAIGCDGWARLHRRLGENYTVDACQPYYGTVPEDEDPCFDVVGIELSTCGRDLECIDETCRAIEPSGCQCPEGTTCENGGPPEPECVPILAVGDICFSADGTQPGMCALDSYCDFQGMLVDSFCVPTPLPGGACEGPWQCESNACEEQVCTAPSPFLCSELVAPRRIR
jgi:hypothetical protein